MKKRLFFAGVFIVLMSLLLAEEIIAKPSERFLSCTLGFGAPGVGTGLDFVYRHRSGFTFLSNFNVSIPIAPMAGFFLHPEFYAGYSFKHNDFYVSFVGGLWVGGGANFNGYELRMNEYGKSDLIPISAPVVIASFGLRNAYMYLFNGKMGITFSHTHGLGIHVGRWFLEETFSFYTMMLKFGLTFKV